jgi:membrane-associated progesterone receptor component
MANLFQRAPQTRVPLPEAEARDYSVDELSDFDGTDSSKPLLIAVRGNVYDVTRGRDFYGPGGPYAMFAGKDCTRALAKVSFDEELFTGDVRDLEAEELEKLDEWIEMFEGKYRCVGRLLPAA